MNRIAQLSFALSASAAVAAAAPVHEWALGEGEWKGSEIASKAGGLKASLPEAPAFAGEGEWDLAGRRGISIEGIKPAALPSRAIAVEAEVSIDRGQAWGGIYTFAQDNGSYERGFLLGYNQRSFVFWISTGGGMIQVTSTTEFEAGRFYHVVGTYDGATVRIFVDGKMEAERAAKGEIAYPDWAYYGIGGYRDKDEDFPMHGKLRAVRLHREALSAQSVLAGAKKFGVEMPLDFAIQPALQFVSPTSARVTWESAAPGGAGVAFGRTRRLGEVVRSEKSEGEHSVLLENLAPGTKYFYKIGWAAGGEKQFSPIFEFTTATNFSRVPIPGAAPEPALAERAAAILEKTGVRKGYALVDGAAERGLALELARASELNVVVLESDPEAALAARNFLYKAGAHGARVTVIDAPGEEEQLPLSSGMANLIVMGGGIAAEEIERLLVPGRGKAFSLVDDRVTGRPRLADAGDWTHQYGDGGNSASTKDRLGGARASKDFALAWVGRPGADFGIDRNPRMPAPLSAAGRLFHQGMNRLVALDARNGAVLWGLEVPDLRRVNVPRDSGNWCADERELFVAIKDRAWALEAETGQRTRTFAAIPGSDDEAEYEWGYIAREGRMLIGSGVKAKTAYSNFWGKERWFDGKAGSSAVEKVCSDSLFGYALDSAGQDPSWTYRKGVIINSTITAHDGKVYFVETRNPAVVDGAKRRLSGAPLWQQQFLVALDSSTGKLAWERPIDTEDGAVSFYLQASGGRLLASASNSKYHLYSFDAASGEPVWNKSLAWPDDHHSGHMQHPVITGGMIYLQPNGIKLGTGELVTSKVGKREGCHTYVGAGGVLLYRGVGRVVSLWDPETETVSNWSRLRPSCWLSTIPASGMLLMPEAGGGCSCGNWMETSVGFIPRIQLGEGGDE